MEQPLIIKAQIQIAKTTNEVYEAIVDPSQMSHYFISQSTGRMDEQESLEWRFPEFDITVPVKTGNMRRGEYVSFYWNDTDGKEMLVEIHLQPKGDSTHILITEKERNADPAGIAWYGRNTEGWANFLACLKAYLEYGINLRHGAFDFMKSH